MRRAPGRAWVFSVGWLAAAGLAPAHADPEEAAPTPAAAGPGAPQLDQLLKLPAGSDYGVERRGGLSRGEWKARFDELEQALTKERKDLATAEARLDETAGSSSNWQVAPVPGMQPSPDAPLDYQLRVEIRRHKSEIERLESKLKQLEIEANLAGVPPEWRS